MTGWPAPYNTIHYQFFYPAETSENSQSSSQTLAPPKAELAPFPVVIFFNGINCSPYIYQSLALHLAQQGLAVITFSWIAENLPGIIALTPGVDLTALKPEIYGTKPTASALPALLTELERLNAQGILAGLLDLHTIILGGHSAGGRVALESADSKFYASIKGAFAYAAHTAAPVMLGYPPETILPLPSSVPILLMGGTLDGVIAANSGIYGMRENSSIKALERTFDEAISRNKNDTYFILLEGANHYAIADSSDQTSSSVSLDLPMTQSASQFRSLISQIIGFFIQGYIKQNPLARQNLETLLAEHSSLLMTAKKK